MQSVYWLCFLTGGTFVTLAALGGIDGAEFDHDIDTDIELTPPRPSPTPKHQQRSAQTRAVHHRLPIAMQLGWSVVTSVRFWTIGSGFFGLTGLLLSGLYPRLGSGAIFGLALSTGALLGTAITTAFVWMHNRQVDSLVRSSDLSGLLGTVELPFDAHSIGKIRIEVRGTLVDFIARTEETHREFEVGDRVLVIGAEDRGYGTPRVWVMALDEASPGLS